MELELRHLRVVCRLADTGSVSKAAAALGVSQPSLTAQLHRIEDAIGGALFERGPYGVVATPLGKHVLGRARAMLADMDDLVGSSRRYTTGSPVLRLAAVRTVMFGAWLSRLEQVLPGREISTQVDPSCAVLTDLLAADVVDVVMLGRCDDAHAPPCPTRRSRADDGLAGAIRRRAADRSSTGRRIRDRTGRPGERHLDLPAGGQGGRRSRVPSRRLRDGRVHARVPLRQPRHLRDRAVDRCGARHQPVRADGP